MSNTPELLSKIILNKYNEYHGSWSKRILIKLQILTVYVMITKTILQKIAITVQAINVRSKNKATSQSSFEIQDCITCCHIVTNIFTTHIIGRIKYKSIQNTLLSRKLSV